MIDVRAIIKIIATSIRVWWRDRRIELALPRAAMTEAEFQKALAESERRRSEFTFEQEAIIASRRAGARADRG